MHDCGRAAQQFAEYLRRNIGPQPDFLGQDAVVFGPFDQTEEAGLGNAGAAIFGDAAGHFTVAAAHQHVGDRLAQRAAR